jgi:glycosyltransferase involved in cell wall biosynthesis
LIKYSLTIITVVHNNLSGLHELYKDLFPLFDGSLQWIIKDSGYCDGVVEWVNSLSEKSIILIVGKDDGIYDALNKSITYVNSHYYMVVGSDDRVITNRLKYFLTALNGHKYSAYDFISFPVKIQGKIFNRRTYIPISWSISSLIASHSCGLVISLSIHDKLGMYSTKYKILADSLLILGAYNQGCKFYYENFPIGNFGIDGVSSRLSIQRAKESFKYQLEAGSPFFLQLLFFSIRLLFFKIKSFF